MTQNERMSIPIWKKLILFFISFFFFILQTVLIYLVFNISFLYTTRYAATYIFFIMEGVGLALVMHIIHRPISASYKTTWSIFILIMPILFGSLYILNESSRKLSKGKQKKIDAAFKKLNVYDDKRALSKINSQGINLVRVVQKSTFAPVYENVKFTFFSDIKDKFEDLLLEVKQAKHYIFIEFFIIAQGVLMDRLLPLLEEKGKEGVEIKILYDDVGSRIVLKRKLLNRIAQIPNCQINNYEPLGLNFNLLVNYRDHRKIFIIDGRVAYCGGDNLADEYINLKQRFGHWRDNCGKYEGEVVRSFVMMFSEMWFISTKEKIKDDLYFPPYVMPNEGFVMAFGDGPMNSAEPAYDLFLSLISSAKQYCYISTPYFIIDDTMIDTIAVKAKSGVNVCLLMPKHPDKIAPYYMGRGNYRELLKAGVKIFEYTPGFNHAKNIIVDDEFAFIGTVNMDYRSLFLHYECGALVIKNPEILKMKEDYEQAIMESEFVEYKDWKKRPWYQKLISYFLNLFAPMF